MLGSKVMDYSYHVDVVRGAPAFPMCGSRALLEDGQLQGPFMVALLCSRGKLDSWRVSQLLLPVEDSL